MIGEMRNRIALQSISGSTDAGGGQSTSFSTAATVWAKVENLSGTETPFGDQLQAKANYRFTIRYYSALTLTSIFTLPLTFPIKPFTVSSIFL